ncbi:MAG: hypothetical protein OEZ65_00085 [Gemmatimonadota bacterium]|nr:hypothetical protein [Gemmatimonadota bacterium]
MSQAIALMGALWGHVGPGLILVAALPLSMLALILVVRTGLRRTLREN